MDDARARTLLEAERRRITDLLGEVGDEADSDRANEDETGSWDDRAQPLTAQGVDDAVVTGLRRKLDAVTRAEARLADGSYGRSVRSGQVIPDERLEADPAAELTVDEAADVVDTP